jgi:hypothetical protein
MEIVPGSDIRQGRIAVAAVSLADALARLATDRVDLLKLDCEGAEYDILMRTTPDVLSRIDRIVMEYHDHRPDVRHPALAAFLRHSGYRVDVFPNVVHPGEIGYMRASRVQPIS